MRTIPSSSARRQGSGSFRPSPPAML
jgi:hypothetical protein